MKKLDIDWPALDWSKRDTDLSRMLSCGVSTVRRWRIKLGKPKPSFRLTQKDKDNATEGRKKALEKGRYASCYERKRKNQTGVPHGHDEKIKKSHLKHKENHPNAKSHKLTSPDGEEFSFDNVGNFVRENKELFLAVDTDERKKPNGKTYNRAASGLLSVSNGNIPSWKGWTI